MARMRLPKVPEDPPSMLSDDHLRKLIRGCEGTGFADRRDMAIVRLFLDTGMRRSALAGLNVDGIDFDYNVALVVGKGGRQRGHVRSITGQPGPATGTFGLGCAIGMLNCLTCGSATAVP